MKRTAIVLAAGKGSRMNSRIQKQFMELNGFPLIYYSLQVFEKSRVDDIILVTGESEIDYCRTEIVGRYRFQKVKCIVAGGSERCLSVYNGLRAVEDTDIVLIHDGARPFVTEDIIDRTIQAAERFGSGVAAMPAKDTIKIADKDQFVVQTPARERVWTIQTPQAFEYRQIYDAYEEVVHQQVQNVTDDAMVMELVLHKPVKLVEGSYRNIKVTTAEDMEIASVFATGYYSRPGAAHSNATVQTS